MVDEAGVGFGSPGELVESDPFVFGVGLGDISGAEDDEFFQGGEHFAYSCDGNIRIGTEEKTIDSWLKKYPAFAEKEDFDERDTMLYGKFIEMCKEAQ